jgi:hypothetical protein
MFCGHFHEAGCCPLFPTLSKFIFLPQWGSGSMESTCLTFVHAQTLFELKICRTCSGFSQIALTLVLHAHVRDLLLDPCLMHMLEIFRSWRLVVLFQTFNILGRCPQVN